MLNRAAIIYGGFLYYICLCMDKEKSKFYKFKPVSKDILKGLFSDSNPSFIDCNVHESTENPKENYVWVRAYDTSFFDLVEETLNAEEIEVEQMNVIDRNRLIFPIIPDVP